MQHKLISGFSDHAGFLSQQKVDTDENISEYILASLFHDVKSPVDFMDIAVAKLKLALLRNDTELAILIADGIGQSLSAVRGRLQELTSFYHTCLAKKHIATTQFDVGLVVGGIVDGLSGVFKQNRNEIVINVPKKVRILSNPALFSIVIHNLLDNASKHCVGRGIEISAEETEHFTRIIVKDDGDGLPAAIAGWLCGAGPLGHEVGVGLILVKKLSAYLGAKIDVSVGNGTLISWTVPGSPECKC